MFSVSFLPRQGSTVFSGCRFWISKCIVLLHKGRYTLPEALLSGFVRFLDSPGRGTLPVTAVKCPLVLRQLCTGQEPPSGAEPTLLLCAVGWRGRDLGRAPRTARPQTRIVGGCLRPAEPLTWDCWGCQGPPTFRQQRDTVCCMLTPA